MERLYTGENQEIVTEATIIDLYETSKSEFEEPCTYSEYLRNVTGSGGYYTPVSKVHEMTVAEFLKLAQIDSLADLDSSELYALDNRTELPGRFIGNSDNWEVDWLKDWNGN